MVSIVLVSPRQDQHDSVNFHANEGTLVSAFCTLLDNQYDGNC